MTKYLVIDAEMGGRELKYSLLTAYFMVVDENINKLDELYLHIKPDDNDYILSGQGMEVNKINLQEHDKIAIPYKQAKPLLFNFLKKNSLDCKLVPLGHGTRGDIAHIINCLISEGSWEQFCSYHYIDTSVVLQYLRACGKMPCDCDGSVKALAEYFGIDKEYSGVGMIDLKNGWHDAQVDAIMTAEIFKRMVELGK